MRTLVKHGVLAASAATLAFVLACGSGNKSSREPASSTENNQGSYTPQQPIAQNPPQAPVFDDNGSAANGSASGASGAESRGSSDSTLGSGGPQKPFYGPGLTNPNDVGSATTNEGTMQGKQVTTLSDGEIFAIEDAANTGEIQMAEIARKHAVAAPVKDFAAMMITHHGEAQTKLKVLAKKDNITPKDDDVSTKLKGDVGAMITELRTKKGHDFDKLYIDDQVKAHRDVLDVVDNQLVPSVQSPSLKSHLAEVRRTVADHLSKAEDLQSKLQPVGTSDVTRGSDADRSGKAKAPAPGAKKGGTDKVKKDERPKGGSGGEF